MKGKKESYLEERGILLTVGLDDDSDNDGGIFGPMLVVVVISEVSR